MSIQQSGDSLNGEVDEFERELRKMVTPTKPKSVWHRHNNLATHEASKLKQSRKKNKQAAKARKKNR